MTTATCAYCGKQFEPIRSSGKYCSPSCRVRACNKRKELINSEEDPYMVDDHKETSITDNTHTAEVLNKINIAASTLSENSNSNKESLNIIDCQVPPQSTLNNSRVNPSPLNIATNNSPQNDLSKWPDNNTPERQLIRAKRKFNKPPNGLSKNAISHEKNLAKNTSRPVLFNTNILEYLAIGGLICLGGNLLFNRQDKNVDDPIF